MTTPALSFADPAVERAIYRAAMAETLATLLPGTDPYQGLAAAGWQAAEITEHLPAVQADMLRSIRK